MTKQNEEDEDVIVAGFQPLDHPPNEEESVAIFSTSTDSLTIAKEAIALSGIGPTPDYVEVVQREVDRGKLHGEAEIEIKGFRVSN